MAFVNLLSAVYPVGSMYFSCTATSPATVIGGTWVQITDAVLRLDTTSIASYSGSDSHTLTVEEMPSHQHWLGAADFGGTAGSNYVPLYGGRSGTTGGWYVGATGNGEAFSVLPRVYSVYAWRRTA